MQLTYLIAYVKEPNNTFSVYIPDVLQKPVYNNPPNNIAGLCELIFSGGISRFVSDYDAYPKPLMYSNELLFNYVKRMREKAGLTTTYMFIKSINMLVDNNTSLLANKSLKSGYIDLHQKIYHPAKVLYTKFMKHTDMSAAELVSVCGYTNTFDIAYLHDFLKSQRSVTPDLASRLSIVFNTSSEFWLTIQKEYDDYMLEKYLSEAIASENVQPIYYKTFREKQ